MNFPLGGGITLPLNVDFHLKWNLGFSCEKLNDSVLVLRLCLKSWLYLGSFETDNAEFTQGGKTCVYKWITFYFLFFILHRLLKQQSHTKYCFSQKCHTTLKIKSEHSLLSLYRDDLLKDFFESHNHASY